MRGLHLDGVPRLRTDLPVPDPESAPGRSEARVRVTLAGVCNTDLELAKGYMPFTGVLGHEFVGIVDAAPGREGLVGARVVGEINAACGRCEVCRRGDGRHCPGRTVLGIAARDGCLADYCALPVENLHRVPDSVPDEAAVFTEPLAAALRIPEQLDLAGSERTLVMGDGKLGLLTAIALRNKVGELLLAGHHEEKLAIAERAGVRAVLSNALDESGFDLVVEATGSAEGMREAVTRVRPLGTVVMKSTVAGDTSLPLSLAVVNELTLVGSRCGPFGAALRALASGEVDPRPLITATYSLDDVEEAMRRAAEPGALKVLVRP